MNEKSVSISVLVENKTTELRLSLFVHITCCTVTLPINEYYLCTSQEDVVTSLSYQSAMVPP